MERERKCVICENILVGRPNKKYCCAECREKARFKKKAEECKKPKVKSEKNAVRRKNRLGSLSIEQINKRARAEGLTYGQYVAKYS